MDNINTELYEYLDLINDTLSLAFVEKWRFKYSERFIKHFQLKLLDSFNRKKPLKKDILFNYLVKKCKYSPEQVKSFFESIDIDMYSPFIFGRLSSKL
jgi:hypothetical protein